MLLIIRAFKAYTLIIFSIFFYLGLEAQVGPPTRFYCYSNGEIYIIPLDATDDCNVASCMVRYYFTATSQKIDDGIIYCSANLVNTDGPYIELISPICPGSISPATGPVV
jgi:hypothetical protein